MREDAFGARPHRRGSIDDVPARACLAAQLAAFAAARAFEGASAPLATTDARVLDALPPSGDAHLPLAGIARRARLSYSATAAACRRLLALGKAERVTHPGRGHEYFYRRK